MGCELLPPSVLHAKRGAGAALLERAVRGLDLALKRKLHIYEFSTDRQCMLRLAIGRNDTETTLADGTRIMPGDPLGELHFWNEHMPLIPEKGVDLAWALNFQRLLIHSLNNLAVHVTETPTLHGIKAFRGDIFFGSGCKLLQMANPVKRCGMELLFPKATGAWNAFTDFWNGVYALALIWCFNPASLHGKGLQRLKRGQLWISRQVLLSRYGRSRQSLPARC